MRSYDEIKKNTWNIQPIGEGKCSALIKLPDCKTCSVVWGTNEDGYEHVSVSPLKKILLPSWDDMAYLKDVFFDDEEEVYQIHPPKSQYVNIKDNCLHLWRPVSGRKLVELK